MGRNAPSRRQLLRSLLAGLFGWLCAARPALARPQARVRPRAWPFPAGRRSFTRTRYDYDYAGRCIVVREGTAAPAQPSTGVEGTIRSED